MQCMLFAPSRSAHRRDEEGNLLNTVVGKGNVMLLNDGIGKKLSLQRADKQCCNAMST